MTGKIFRLLDSKSTTLSLPSHKLYDVAVIGAGVVGCAIARRFSQTGLSVAVVDRATDVGEGGASKSNSAIAHCGFDAEPGSLEAKLVTSASRRWPALAEHLKIPFSSVGALMLARSEDDMKAIKKYYKRSLENGVNDVELLSGYEARAMEPFAFENEKLLGGLHIPREAVVDPFATCEAFAETALTQGGCDFYFQADVDYVAQFNESNVLVAATKQGLHLKAKNVINSAGLGAGALAKLYNGKSFTLNPRRGQFLVYDNLSRPLLQKILLPVPGPLGKGILVTPTIFGNLLAGPTAEDMPMEQLAEATQTTLQGLEEVKTSVTRSLARLKSFKPVAQYAGARSNCKEGSFLFSYGDGGNPNIVTLAGIRSTGLSTSFAVADEVFEQMAKRSMIQPKYDFTCTGRTRFPSWYHRQARPSLHSIKRDTVCFCESVDKHDIVESLRSPMSPGTTDGVKRRTRATTGRCQGFNCLVDVCKIISSEAKVPMRSISKRGPGTEWFPNYRDTSSPGYIKTEALKSSPLFSRMELFNSSVSPVAWNQDERFQTIVVGAGPAGCGVVAGMTRSLKIDKLLLIERSDRIGGVPARYPASVPKKTFVHFTQMKLVSGFQVAEELRNELFSSSFSQKIHIKLNSTVLSVQTDGNLLRVITHDGHSFLADSVVFTMGAREANAIERECITGHRGARAVFSNHLLMTGGPAAVCRQEDGPSIVSVGSGLVARSILANKEMAQKVRFLGLQADEAPLLASWYFGGSKAHRDWNEVRAWAPSGVTTGVELIGSSSSRENVSAIIYAGALVPNDEVLTRSSFTRRNLPPGVFMAGNVLHSHGSPWPGVACYLHAKHVVAKRVLRSFM